MKNRGDKFRALLKKYDFQSLPDDFTEEVIQEINANADYVSADSRLKSVLGKNLAAEPSTGFTYSVLNKVKDDGPVKYPPIINNKAWALITVFIVVCIILSGDMNDSRGPMNELLLLPLGNYLSTFTAKLLEPLFYVGVIVLSGGLLLLIDYLLKKVLRSNTSA